MGYCKGGNGVEDKKIYNRVMFFAFCLIVILLISGMYSWFHGNDASLRDIEPSGKSQVVEWEERDSQWELL